MIGELTQVAMSVQDVVVAFRTPHVSHDSSNSGELALLLAGPASGVGFFWYVFRYYRNTDKSHDFEHETAIAPTGPLTGTDTKVDEVRGVRNSEINGDNSRDFRARVRRL